MKVLDGGWIDAREALPPVGEDVLVCSIHGERSCGWVDSLKEWCVQFDEANHFSVALWQRLPNVATALQQITASDTVQRSSSR